MILVCGSDLQASDLPYSEDLQYKVIPASAKSNIAMSLKVIAPKDACVTVYIRKDFENMVLHALRSKTIFFEDDEDLLKQVNGVPEQGELDFDLGTDIMDAPKVESGNIEESTSFAPHGDMATSAAEIHTEPTENPMEAPKISEEKAEVHGSEAEILNNTPIHKPAKPLRAAAFTHKIKQEPVQEVKEDLDFQPVEVENPADFAADDFGGTDFTTVDSDIDFAPTEAPATFEDANVDFAPPSNEDTDFATPSDESIDFAPTDTFESGSVDFDTSNEGIDFAQSSDTFTDADFDKADIQGNDTMFTDADFDKTNFETESKESALEEEDITADDLLNAEPIVVEDKPEVTVPKVETPVISELNNTVVESLNVGTTTKDTITTEALNNKNNEAIQEKQEIKGTEEPDSLFSDTDANDESTEEPEALFDDDDDFIIPEDDLDEEGYKQLLAEKDNHIESLAARIKQLESFEDKSKIEEISKTLDATKQSLQDAQNNNENLTNRIKELEATNSELNNKLVEVANTPVVSPEVAEELSRTKSELTNVQEQLNAKINEVQTISTELKSVKIELSDVNAQLEFRNTQIEENNTKLGTVTTELEECKAKLKNSVSAEDYNELQKQFTELSAKGGSSAEVEDLKSQLAAKENLIHDLQFQKDSAFEEVNIARREAEEDKAQYEEMMNALEEKVSELETAAAAELVAPSDLGAYDGYTVKPRAYIRPTLKPNEELVFTGMDCSDVTIIAHGYMDSLNTNIKTLADFVIGKSYATVLDLSLSVYLPLFMRANPAPIDYTELARENFDVSRLINKRGNTSVLNMTVAHDIAFLTMDWANVIKNLKAYSSGNPIVILLPSIDSFPTLYTFVKLSSVVNGAKSLIVSSAHPLCINQLKFRLAVVESPKFTIALTDAMAVPPEGINKALSNYNCKLFAKGMEYEKLGLI